MPYKIVVLHLFSFNDLERNVKWKFWSLLLSFPATNVKSVTINHLNIIYYRSKFRSSATTISMSILLWLVMTYIPSRTSSSKFCLYSVGVIVSIHFYSQFFIKVFISHLILSLCLLVLSILLSKVTRCLPFHFFYDCLFQYLHHFAIACYPQFMTLAAFLQLNFTISIP